MIRFSSKKRDEFVHAAEHRQAVKLVNTQKSISKCLFKWTERCCAAVISKLAGGRRADASVQAAAYCGEAQGAEGNKPNFINGVQVGCDPLQCSAVHVMHCTGEESGRAGVGSPSAAGHDVPAA